MAKPLSRILAIEDEPLPLRDLVAFLMDGKHRVKRYLRHGPPRI